ncbi:transcriptional regulator [Bibersteinia trehalosi Y31]|uniref:Transcriptional regulator n=1 Tax=Bibersteinia trehalosi Y31 TaxID=1261658 RepID=A0A179CVR3_BIBTR|nr:transcriptional regulator [Bibersteinia trehalosi Y31]
MYKIGARMEEKQSGNQSLIRGLKLLTLLGNFPNGCPLAKLAELSELNKSTVHRLLQGLQSEGFVRPAATAGSYRLSTKCLSLGQKTLASMNIINIAAPYLEQVNLNLGETVNFSKREGWHSILIYKLEPTVGMMRTRAYIGQHQQLYCSAMGKLYLAYDADETALQHYWHINEANIQQLTCYTITEKSKMAIELEEIRQLGFAMDREENELGVCCIAVPVFNHLGQIEYALSVSASTHRLNKDTQENFLKELQIAAQGISKELGYNC